jgi:hypothetical protein
VNKLARHHQVYPMQQPVVGLLTRLLATNSHRNAGDPEPRHSGLAKMNASFLHGAVV